MPDAQVLAAAVEQQSEMGAGGERRETASSSERYFHNLFEVGRLRPAQFFESTSSSSLTRFPRAQSFCQWRHVHRDFELVAAGAHEHAAQRAHVVKISTPSERDMASAGQQIVGRIQINPA